MTADGGPVVRLIGGPMDGWLVKPDAPALKPDWGVKNFAGRAYFASERDEDGTPTATWSVAIDASSYEDAEPVYVAGDPVDEEVVSVDVSTERFQRALALSAKLLGDPSATDEWVARAEKIMGRPLTPEERTVVLVSRHAALDMEQAMGMVREIIEGTPADDLEEKRRGGVA